MTSNSAGSSGTKVSSTQMMLKEVEQALSILDDKKLSATHPTFVQAQESLRRHVCEQTRTRLTDLDKVAAELAKDSSAPGQSQVILDFLLFLMSRNPVTFTSNMSSDSEQKNLLDFQICKDLDKWLLARLLHILTDFQCKSIHLKVCDVICELLKLLKRRALHLYQEVVMDLLQIVARICNIFSEKFNHGAIEILEEPVVLEVFPWQPDQSNRPASQEGSFDFTAVFAESKPVTLEHLSSCYLLQFNMSNILKKMVQDGGIFLAKHTGFLWALLCCQLEQCHLPIKEVSLHLMGSLLEQGNNPPVELQEYFADLLVGSLNLILVSHQDDPFVEVQEAFEESLAKCLDALFVETFTGKPSICSMQSLLEMLLEVIAETIPQNGLDSVRTDKLLESISGVAIYMAATLPSGFTVQTSSGPIALSDFSSFIIEGLGKLELSKKVDNEVFVKPLVAIILLELSGCEDILETKSIEGAVSLVPVVTSESSDVSGDEKTERKGRLSRTKTTKSNIQSHTTSESYQDLEISSPTFQHLKMKFKQLCQATFQAGNMIDAEVMSVLTGLHTVLKVIRYSCATIDDRIKTARPQTAKEGKQHPLMWYSLEDLQQVLSVLVRTLKLQKTTDKEVFSRVFSVVADCGGLLMSTSDGMRSLPKVSHECCWILSFPWLPFHSNWMDLKISGDFSDDKEVALLSNEVNSKIDDESIATCLKYLALFPKSVAPKWRLIILRTALSDKSEVVVKAGLNSFQFFLFHLGANYIHLLQDIVMPHVDGCSDAIAESLARVVGPILCVLNKQCSLNWNVEPNKKSMPLPEIVCSVCTGDSIPAEHIEARVVSPFLALLSRKADTKLDFIRNLPSIFQHLDLQHPNTAVSKVVKACMELSTDKQQEVRDEFRKRLKFLVNSGKPCSSSNIKAVISKLKSAFDSAKAASDCRLAESVVMMLGELGRVADGELLLVVIISLLDSLLSSSNLVKAAALLQLKEVATAKGFTLPNLFTKFKGQICKFTVDAMEEAVNKKKSDITLIADTVASALEFADTKTFLSKNLKLVLPLMVKKASEVSTALLRVLGELLQMKHRELLVINFKYVFSYLVRNCSKDELEKALFYVHRETEFDFSSLLHIDYQSFHNELLLHLSENYSKVFSGLAMLAAKDDSYNGPRPITQTEDMADFLQPRLLGILAFFDSQLLNSHIPLEDKKLALESLVCIMRLMGPKHITGVRVKVMTTLKIGLQYKEHGFPLLSCRAWDCYVRSVEPSALGPMLSQVIVTLLPLLQELPSQVSAIFHFLIVENQKTFSDHFRELYFMPSLVELQEVNKVIARHKEHHSTQPDVRNQLREAMKGVAHDSVDVRVHALSKLRDLLYTNQSSLHEFVMGSEDVDSIITELLSVLLSGCRDSNSEAQSLFGECLGALGAVDPGLLDLGTSSKKHHRTKVYTNVDDMNFAYDLIIELARGFLAASDTRAQDCSAYAIQEMLQVYRCGSKESTSSSGQQLWQKFPQHIQEILTPLLHTKYVPSNPSVTRDVPKPIYRSAKGSTYKDWVCFWTGHLVNMMVKEEKSSTVFKACRVIIKHDINTALFLLPYILQHVLIDSNQEQKAEIQDEILAVLRHDDGKAREESHLSAQTVFSVLDHLTRWKQQRAQELMSLAKTQSKAALAKAASHDQDAGILAVTKFLKQIPQDVLSRASYQCKAYARALMHFEAHLKSDGNNLQNHLPFLQKIYVALDEPDGVLGVSATRMVKPTLNDQILDHESKGKLGEAQACYEQAIQLDPNHLGNHQGLLKSLMDLGQLNTALNLVNGVLADKPALTSQLNAYRVEACWKLSRWDSLETHLQKETSTSDWRIGLGRILLAVRNKDLSEFEKQLKVVRSAQMGPLSAASMEKGSYQRGYEFITRLHMLSDLERGLKQLVSSEVGEDSRSRRADERLFSEWNNRLALTQASFRVQEPLLCMRRIILGLFDPNNHPSVKQEIGQSWLKSAKVARKANQMQTAYSFLLNASYYSLPEFFLEKAEWLWNKGDGHQALICLQNGVAEHFPPSKMQQNLKQREAHAKALLLIGRCMEDTAKFESNSVMKQYKEVSDVHPEWEDGYFYMAKYYDRLMLNFTDRPEKAGEFVIRIIQNFGQSLRYGNQHIYQSMPRLLSHWLDFGAHVAELENMKGRTKSDKVENIKAVLSQLNAMVKDFTNKLAPYQFLTSFSQLISRICHAHPAVFQHLTEIISKVLANFPQQSVWMSMAVSKSTNQMRQLRCRDIFRRATQLDKNLEKFIRDATKLTDRLLELCNKSVERDCNLLSINKDFRNLKRLVTDRNFSQIIVPLQSLMTVTLPSTQTAHKQHDPFPTTPVYISGFDDGVEVLASLQQPKKISIQGNDGKVYAMLCKPKDDLRKDNRLMEVNGIINKCLMKDADARWRQLHIRTYAVIPLNEECGLIEWVPNTSGLRHILTRLYRQKGIFLSSAEIKALFPAQIESLETKLRLFNTKLLPKYPPVFGEWFLKTFPDPTSWYLSRLSYARTAAVMSMVGYILGLGDRHGENILLDSTRGDCVHVDFNCLFNKGETFDWPERVPFRLTQNLLHGMGPLGFEGVFRRACEVTMTVMRDQKDPLMSVLRTLIYDPLVEWSKPSRSRSTVVAESGEVNNEKAQVHVRDIEQRLQGILKTKHKARGLPLSIEGHVDYLIREATDPKNLCQMYVGWASYL